MGDIQQCLIQILSQHYWGGHEDGSCACGPIESMHPVFVTEYDWAAHVTQLLTAELGFDSERHHGMFGMTEDGIRWTTPWERVS